MPKAPPLLPHETLARVLRTAQVNGMCVALFSGVFALISASNGDYVGVVVGLLVAAGGAMEVHGGSLIRHAEIRGVRWLVVSQLLLLIVIVGFAWMSLREYHPELLKAAMTDEMRATVTESGMKEDDFLRLSYNLIYGTIAVVTFFYQGGMALYYLRRRKTLEQAIATFEV